MVYRWQLPPFSSLPFEFKLPPSKITKLEQKLAKNLVSQVKKHQNCKCKQKIEHRVKIWPNFNLPPPPNQSCLNPDQKHIYAWFVNFFLNLRHLINGIDQSGKLFHGAVVVTAALACLIIIRKPFLLLNVSLTWDFNNCLIRMCLWLGCFFRKGHALIG